VKREQVVAQMEARRVELVDAVEARIREEILEYAALKDRDSETFGSTRRSLQHAIERIVDCALAALRADASLSVEDRAAVANIAADRAVQGFPVAAVTQAVHVAFSVGLKTLFSVMPEGDTPEAVGELQAAVGVLHRVEYDIVRAVQEGFQAAGDQTALARTAFLRLVLERPIDSPMALQASRLGIDLSPPLAVVGFVDAAGDPLTFAERSQACAQALPLPVLGPQSLGDPSHVEAGIIAAWPGNEAAIASLVDVCKRHDIIAVYAVARSTDGLPVAVERVRGAGMVMPLATRRLGPVASVDDTVAHLLAAGLPPIEQTTLVRERLGPLITEGGGRHAPEYLRTLEVLYQHEGTTAVAKALIVHPQTLRQRVRRIRHLTGFDPHRDRLSFEVALLVYRFHEDEWPPSDDPWWNP